MENDIPVLTHKTNDMKTLKLFLTLCLAAMVTTASAQFANADSASGKSTKSGSALVKDTDPYNRVYVSYSPLKLKADGGAADIKMTGFSAGYLHGFNLSGNLPLFLEVGGNLAYSFGDEGDDYFKVKYNLFSVNVPVNVAYKLTFGDSGFSLTPFLGINLRYNISSKAKVEGDLVDELGDLIDWGDLGDLWGDLGLDDPGYYGNPGGPGDLKHFQVGWQIGVGFNYKKLYVGVSYGSDFSEIAEKTKMHTTQISLGLNF